MNESIRSWFDWRGWVLVFSAIAIGLGLAAILSPAFREFIANSTTAAWAAAIATFLAAAIALLVASGESRRRQRDLLAMAALYAAYLAPKLENYRDELLNVCAAGIFIEGESARLTSMKHKLQSIEFDVTLEQVMHLVPLERNAAHRIAHGLAEAQVVCNTIRGITHPHMAYAGRAEELRRKLTHAVEHISVATAACKAHAAKYALPPSGQELYGYP